MPYLQLLRPANVVTALADVLAGSALAIAVAGTDAASALPWLLVSTACLYAGGVVLNDVFDRDVDRVERPERPIPSRRVSVAGAARLGGGLLAAGALAAFGASRTAGYVAVAIAACVLLYDAWGKRHDAIGPANMALCRALNLLLGVSAAPVALTSHWPIAAVPWLYIWGITTLSRGEVHGGDRRAATAALVSVALAITSLTYLAVQAGTLTGAALVLAAFLGWRVLPPFAAARRHPAPAAIRHAVRRGVLSLVILDATIAAAFGSAILSAAILGTGVVAAWLARRYAVT